MSVLIFELVHVLRFQVSDTPLDPVDLLTFQLIRIFNFAVKFLDILSSFF